MYMEKKIYRSNNIKRYIHREEYIEREIYK